MWCDDSDKYLKEILKTAEKVPFMAGVKNLIEEAFHRGRESMWEQLLAERKAIEALEKKKNDPVQDS